MAAPKTGRIFLRSHGDCFIHATAFFVKYWNFSLAQEGLGIVQVTLVDPEERVFLACISPTPLPYEHVKRGMNHRKYLEMDPRFAAELGITHDTEVVLEPVRVSIERCQRLKVTPKNPEDYDILCNNIEKINYELTDKIRVVSCQVFFTFPVWINHDVILVKVVSSIPSANWVMIMPDVTIMELARSGGTESDCDSTSATTVDTMNTIPTPDQTDEDAFLQLSQNSQPHQSSSFPNQTRSRSSASAESSVDMESSIGDNWNIHSLLMKAQRLFSITGLRGSVQDTVGEVQDTVEEGEDDIVMTEPGRKRDTRFMEYPFQSQEGLTITRKDLLNSELKDKFATSLCVRGSLTPEPITTASPRKANSHEPSHKRMATWHSESQFSSRSGKKPQKTLHKLTPYVSTPRMHANLRVQPHPLKGIRHTFSPSHKPSNESLDHLWSEKRAFDVFVHPSTLPEVYHYLQKKSTSGSFLVELSLIPQLNKYTPKTAESGSKPDSVSTDGNNGNGTTSQTQNMDTGLPASLVVRLCFATQVAVLGDDMTTSLSETPQEVGVSGGVAEEGKKAVPRVSVPVKVGQVLMSDLVRQQLEIKECSRVKILHVNDNWKMSFVDGIKVVVQPMNYEKKSSYKHLLESVRDWIRLVSDVSKFGAVLVNKQIVTLRDKDGELVNCQLKVTSGRLITTSSDARIAFCLLTPSDFSRNRVTLLVDSVTNRSTLNFRRRATKENAAAGRREEGQGDPLKLPEISLLNQHVITTMPRDYGAFSDLLAQGYAHLHTVFMGRKRCGTLLVCGMSGTAGAGCGKTSLVNLIAKEAQAPPYHAYVQVVNCTYLRSQTTSRTRKRLLSLFSEVIQKEPSVLILEDLDHAMPHVSDAQEQVQEEGNNSINKTQVFRDLLRAARCQEAQVLVIATARNKQELNRELLTSQGTHTFDRVLEIEPPTLDSRKDIVEAILRRKGFPTFSDSDLRAVASRTEGFQAGDLVTLIDRAISHSELRALCPAHSTPFDTPADFLCHRMSIESGSDLSLSLELSSSPQKPSYNFSASSLAKALDLSNPQLDSGISSPISQAKKKLSVVSTASLTPTTPRSLEKVGVSPLTRVGSLSQMVLTVHDFVTALDGFVPVSLRGLPLHTTGTMDFLHVGGLEKTKQALRETLLWPSKYPKLFSQCTIKQRCGVLLYGAPGTGKTLLAGAVAKEFGLNFVSVKGPELLSKYIGASEKAVRDIFTRAQSARPCILFFDEFDSLAPRRGHDNTGVTDRVVNQMLTQLDGVETLQGVYVLAASSRPDLIDPALLRPGRIDIKLFCSMPDEDERYEILRTLSKDVKTSINVNLCELARSCYTEHFTGADLKALLYNAQLQSVHTVLDEEKKKSLKSSSHVPETPESSPDTSSKTSTTAGSSPMVFSWTEEEGAKQQPTVPEEIALKVSMLASRVQRRRRNTTLVSGSTSGDAALERSPSSVRARERQRRVVVTQEILLEAVGGVRPSVSEPERIKYSKIYEKFSGKPTIKEPVNMNIEQKVTHA